MALHLLLACATLAVAAAKRRNVVLVVFDDLRAAHNVYGWRQSATPVADTFAKDALVFDRVYCQQVLAHILIQYNDCSVKSSRICADM